MPQLSVAPEGFWLKSHFYRSGHMLHVVTYSCIAGEPEIFRASVDLRPIIAKVTALHNQLHGAKVSGEEVDAEVSGFFSSIAKVVTSPAKAVANVVTHPGRSIKDAGRAIANPGKSVSSLAKSAAKIAAKVGKSKLVSQVGAGVKSVVKSKITGAALGGLAIAFPPVGAPAVAAYAAANTALKAIEMANAAKSTAQQIVSSATSATKKAQLKGELQKWAGAELKAAAAAKKPIPKGLSSIAAAMKLVADKAKSAKSTLAKVAMAAKAGDVEAKKVARVVTLAASARKQLTAVKKSTARNTPHLKQKAPVSSQLNGFPALLVNRAGKIIPGRYVEKAGAPRGVLLRQGKVLRGHFAQVSGDGGFDLIEGMSLIGGVDFGSDDDVAGALDEIGRGGHHGGESNPFNKPAHLR
jgi:hypothetical protein